MGGCQQGVADDRYTAAASAAPSATEWLPALRRDLSALDLEHQDALAGLFARLDGGSREQHTSRAEAAYGEDAHVLAERPNLAEGAWSARLRGEHDAVLVLAREDHR